MEERETSTFIVTILASKRKLPPIEKKLLLHVTHIRGSKWWHTKKTSTTNRRQQIFTFILHQTMIVLYAAYVLRVCVCDSCMVTEQIYKKIFLAVTLLNSSSLKLRRVEANI